MNLTEKREVTNTTVGEKITREARLKRLYTNRIG